MPISDYEVIVMKWGKDGKIRLWNRSSHPTLVTMALTWFKHFGSFEILDWKQDWRRDVNTHN